MLPSWNKGSRRWPQTNIAFNIQLLVCEQEAAAWRELFLLPDIICVIKFSACVTTGVWSSVGYARNLFGYNKSKVYPINKWK